MQSKIYKNKNKSINVNNKLIQYKFIYSASLLC